MIVVIMRSQEDLSYTRGWSRASRLQSPAKGEPIVSNGCDHPETRNEEIVNAITHGLGMLLSVAGLVTLLVLAARDADPWRMATFSIYGISLVLLYLASTCYHVCPAGRAKDVFRLLDHAAIYFLIAGTYTPFMLVSIGGGWGWSIVSVLWMLAAIGTVIKTRVSARSTRLSTILYIAMGWIGLVAVAPILQTFSTACILWILAGGVAYTAGVIFFVWDRLPFNHAVWHLFVMKGSACHFLAVLLYVLPVK
jgi:hemolysin III